MKPTFYYGGHYRDLALQVKDYLNDQADFLSIETVRSTRTAGDALEGMIADVFNDFLGDFCQEYSRDFSRRAMADLAFIDSENFYTIVDVKTHREGTEFNMPNLTSVERISRFYESKTNVFSLLMVKYKVESLQVVVTDVKFAPIEFLDWSCLTIGALGWGQIQIKNSNNIQIVHGYSRKQWMLHLCDLLMNIFYPGEILKIEGRVGRFEQVRQFWLDQPDT
ncbi:hypothetical protein [Leptolyngbya sp. PCC 6406]|uniref:hypothetical protein n=1 Tax=Leptolyngbya sp. PCC 6406 TaxID=1173264 RepID=UPI0002AB9C97|nr:hypothetical protein [Leptolyngbya sp. PCC 6406]